MDSSTRALTDNSVDFLKNFRKLSAKSAETLNKSTIQLSKDGSTVITTRRHSMLARFIAHVCTKLSSKDFFDSYGIANKHRQKQAVDKFFEVMEKKYHYKSAEASPKSLSLAELAALLQKSGANSLRDLMSISEFDPNKIASGSIADNLKKFANIDFNTLNEEQKLALSNVYDSWQTTIQEELELQGFSNDEIGYVLASLIEEAAPMLRAILENPDKSTDYITESENLAIKLAFFIGADSQRDWNIEDTAGRAIDLMQDYSNFANVMSNIDPHEEYPHNFAKSALIPVIQAASMIRTDYEANGHIAAGGGAKLAAISGQDFSAPNIPNTIGMDPLFSRCTDFTPIKAALSISGLMRGADLNCKNDESEGKIIRSEVREACVRSATKTINKAKWSALKKKLRASSLPNLISIIEFDPNKIASESIADNLEKFADIDFNTLNEEQKLALSSVHDRWLITFERELEDQGFSSDEIGCVLASLIEEAAPMLHAIIKDPNKSTDYITGSENLAQKLAVFISKYSHIDSEIEETASAAIDLMQDYSNFANVMSNIDLREKWPHKFAGYALFPVIQAASIIRTDEDAKKNIVAGGGTVLAAILGQDFFTSDIPSIISMDPLFSRCTNFSPIKVALNSNGLMQSADLNCQKNESDGKIIRSEVREVCVRTATSTIDKHGYRQFFTDSMSRDYTLADFKKNKLHRASFEQISGLEWGELTNEQKERAVSICNDLMSFPRSLNSGVSYQGHTIFPIDKYLKSMRPLIAEFSTNEEFANNYKQNAEILKDNAKNLAQKCLGEDNAKVYPDIAAAQTKLIQPLMYLTECLGNDMDIELLSDLIAFKAVESLEKADLKQMSKAVQEQNSLLSTYLLYSRAAQSFIEDDAKMTSTRLNLDKVSHQEALMKSITQKIALLAYAMDSIESYNFSDFDDLKNFQNGKDWLTAGRLTDAEKKYYESERHEDLELFARFGKVINKSIIDELKN